MNLCNGLPENETKSFMLASENPPSRHSSLANTSSMSSLAALRSPLWSRSVWSACATEKSTMASSNLPLLPTYPALSSLAGFFAYSNLKAT